MAFNKSHTYAVGNGVTKEVKSSTLSLEQFMEMISGDSGTDMNNVVTAYRASVWAYRAAQIRANAVAGVPIQVFDERTGEIDLEHPLNRIFNDAGSDIIRKTELSLSIWGESFIEIARSAFGNNYSLKWMNPIAVSMDVGANGIQDFVYSPNDNSGESIILYPDEVVFMHYFNPRDDLRGLSPMEIALDSIGVGSAVTEHAHSFFSNGAVISGIVSVPGAMDDQIDAIERKWRRVVSGVSNFFKTMFIGGNATYTPFGAAPKDLAMPELSREARRDICAAFGVPPVIAGAWEAANYATAEEQRKSLYTETILPELDFIADNLNREFVSRFFSDVYIEFDTTQIRVLRENEQTRNQSITTAYQGGWMTLNEARRRGGLPEVENGDKFYDGSMTGQ